jgi:membrane-associated phospholipid phosphatase
MNWKEALSDNKYRLQAIVTLIVLATVLYSLTTFLNFIEARQGIILPDPLLSHFKPINLTWLIFGLIYLSLILAVYDLSKYPGQLLFTLQAYSLLVVVRIAAMYVMPLNPPPDMIPLNDPFVQYFGTGRLLTKDLFFSGHTATIYLLFLTAQNKKLKLLFLSCTVVIGLSVLLQHVHYSIDVFAAPFFTYCAFSAIHYFYKKPVSRHKPGVK